MKEKEMMSSRGKTLAAVLIVAALAFSASLPGPASAEPVAAGSCGSVVVQGAVTYKLTIEKGLPSCGAVRRIAKKYGHPISKPKFYCGNKSYACEYSIYPEGWRCGGLFQGTFQCWHGANSPLRANQVFYGTEDLSARPRIRRPLDAFESAAWPSLRRSPTSRLPGRNLHREGLEGSARVLRHVHP